jgi:2,5-furandicarboxylate decarboxylase 1
MKDLRSFLRELESGPGPVYEVHREVSPDRELAAIVKLLEARGNPVVYFHKVTGSPLPVIAGIHGDRERIALALGTSVSNTVEHFLKRLEERTAPEIAAAGPVKDVKFLNEDVDLEHLPIPTHAEKDGGRFLTAAVGIARDRETNAVNTGIYRMMVLDRNHVTVGTGTDLGVIIEDYHRAGEIVEFAAVVGHHPAFQVSSQAKIPRGKDSFEVASALLGEPIVLVDGESVNLQVPAAAEIVIEGRFEPGRKADDGPFGESPRYYDSHWGYVLEITAITHRKDAMFLDLNNVHQEHRCLSIFPAREAQLLAQLRAVFPHVRAVRMPLSCAAMHVYISVDPRRDGEAKQILMVALGAFPRLKHAVAVNTDVDITDHESVLWALTTRFQGDRDLIVAPYVAGTSMDPSSYTLEERHVPGEIRTQVGFDATMPVSLPFRERADLLGADFKNLDLDAYAASTSESATTPWRERQ